MVLKITIGETIIKLDGIQSCDRLEKYAGAVDWCYCDEEEENPVYQYFKINTEKMLKTTGKVELLENPQQEVLVSCWEKV